MPEWLVYHEDENLQPVGSFKPVINSLSWDIMDGVEVSYEIALADTNLRRDGLAPKRTTWKLYNYGNLVDIGIHSNRNLKTSRDTVLVQGKSFLWWLDNVIYPYDPRNHRPYAPFNQTFWTATTRKDIVSDLVLALQANSVPNPSTPSGFFPSGYAYGIGVTGDNGGTINYQFDYADSRSILQHIKDLGDAEDGFDFRFDPLAMSVELGSPDFDTGSPIFTFDSTLPAPNALIDIDWDDDGPEATFTYGRGAGGAHPPAWISTYEPSLQTYHRWDKVEDFGEVKNLIELKTKTANKGFLERFPMKRITIRVNADPNILSGFWTATRPRNIVGQRVHVKHDFLPYHLIDSSYLITKLTLDCKPSGDVIATMTGDIINT